MSKPKNSQVPPTDFSGSVVREDTIEYGFIGTVLELSHFPFFKDFKEQQTIPDCFTSLEDLIAGQTQKLEALRTHKKGLMQQIFPSPEKVEV